MAQQVLSSSVALLLEVFVLAPSEEGVIDFFPSRRRPIGILFKENALFLARSGCQGGSWIIRLALLAGGWVWQRLQGALLTK